MGARALGMGLTRGLCYQFTTKTIFVVKIDEKNVFSPAGYPWGAGYGIMQTPLSVVPLPTQQKDVSHVAPPSCHRACA